jgi:hypothetical protein
VSKALDIEAIKGRAGTLSDAEGAGRLALFMAGKVDWQLGDRIKATLADVKSLVTRVEELEAALAARRDSPALLSALLGFLRAEGYQVTEPGAIAAPDPGLTPAVEPTVRKFDRAYLKDDLDLPGGPNTLLDDVTDTSRWSIHYRLVFRVPGMQDGLAWETSYSVGATESQDECPWDDDPDVECTLVRLASKVVPAWVPACEDEPVHPSLAAAERAVDAAPFLTDAEREDVIDEPRICPSCEKPLPPDGKCRSPYVDCRSATSDTGRTPLRLEAHQFVRIADGHWAGRYAVATGEVNDTGAPCVTVVGKSITLGDAIDVERVFVVNPDVDAADDPPTKAEAPAAKGRRAEPPKLVTEWAPDGRDFEGYAKDLGCSVEVVKQHVDEFKACVARNNPDMKQARWGKPFKDWARPRLSNQA